VGRGSQLFWFLNAPEVPTAVQQRSVYTHLTITEGLRGFRQKYRQKKNESEDKKRHKKKK